MHYISVKALAERWSVHPATIWRQASSNPLFPQPVRLSGGITRWKLDEVEAWEAASRSKTAAMGGK